MSNLSEQMTLSGTTHDAAPDEISEEVVDRIVLAVDHAAELARRSAVTTDAVALRKRMLRRNRQARFSQAWGLR